LKDSQKPTKTAIERIDVDTRLCLVCGTCVGVCPANAMFLDNDRLNIFEEDCTYCRRCLLICPVRALSQGVEAE
jgi:ferredoxin